MAVPQPGDNAQTLARCQRSSLQRRGHPRLARWPLLRGDRAGYKEGNGTGGGLRGILSALLGLHKPLGHQAAVQLLHVRVHALGVGHRQPHHVLHLQQRGTARPLSTGEDTAVTGAGDGRGDRGAGAELTHSAVAKARAKLSRRALGSRVAKSKASGKKLCRRAQKASPLPQLPEKFCTSTFCADRGVRPSPDPPPDPPAAPSLHSPGTRECGRGTTPAASS